MKRIFTETEQNVTILDKIYAKNDKEYTTFYTNKAVLSKVKLNFHTTTDEYPENLRRFLRATLQAAFPSISYAE